jgi:hypothetical protein
VPNLTDGASSSKLERYLETFDVMTSRRYVCRMQRTRRHPTTVHLEPGIARAIRVRTALTGESLSDLVNDALAKRLREEEGELRIIRQRRKEPSRPYEEFLKELKRDGLI